MTSMWFVNASTMLLDFVLMNEPVSFFIKMWQIKMAHIDWVHLLARASTVQLAVGDHGRSPRGTKLQIVSISHFRMPIPQLSSVYKCRRCVT